MNEAALDLFCRACGVDDPLVLECWDRGRVSSGPEIRTFRQAFLLVGRDPRCDLQLGAQGVSRLHAYFQAVGGRLFCLEMPSRTGLVWADQRTEVDRGWLDHEQVVNIGDYSIRRILGETKRVSPGSTDDPPRALPTAPDGPSPLPRVALEWPIRTSRDESLWRLPSVVTLVGRSEGCHLTLSDSSVSRFHASFVRTPSGLWVVDLGSREGVFVGGVRVRWAWLDAGDTVRIGRFSFVSRYMDNSPELHRHDVPISAGAMPEAPEGSYGPRSGWAPGQSEGRELALRSRSIARPSMPAVRAPLQAVVGLSMMGVEPSFDGQSLSQSAPMTPAMWQQQLQVMESFHNDMILMVQLFVAMHREHVVTVRAELDRVEQLTRELSTLQEKLTQIMAPGGDRASPQATAAPSVGQPETVRDGALAVSRQASSRSALSESPNAAISGDPDSKVRDITNTSRIPEAPPTDMNGSGQSSDCIATHSLLTQRIAMLQRERQGYWRRIISQISR
ncbi:FHA domain-containing protein [Aquisphaera insulae]|uniref:FHA domain-containing protein n=1 Tax=Aquisphaera insulae TaxID=2712864 RepID=UPI0013ECF98E|nr:FHA domain-containing protein [Aquisphaera insulae]